MLKRKKDEGFTLIELMIVIAVIGILAVVLIPKIGNVKTAAKLTGVQSNFQSTIATLQAGQSTFAGATDSGAALTGSVFNYLTSSSVGYGNAASITTATSTSMTNPITGKVGVADTGTVTTASSTPAIVINAALTGTPPTFPTTAGTTSLNGAVVVCPNITGGTGTIAVYACDDTGKPIPSLSTVLNF